MWKDLLKQVKKEREEFDEGTNGLAKASEIKEFKAEATERLEVAMGEAVV